MVKITFNDRFVVKITFIDGWWKITFIDGW